VSQEDIENAKRGVVVLNEAYRSNDVTRLRPFIEALWDPEVLLVPTGIFPDSEIHRGWTGVLEFVAEQMEAFEDGSMWFEALEFIDAGGALLIPYRFGGRARHTEIDVEFSYSWLATIRRGKVVRVDIYETKEEALQDLGLQGGA
jgi:hypothetical protein